MARIKCPHCDRDKPAFAIVNGRCREDMADEARANASPVVLTWNDIRGRRRLRLEACDWTQVVDAPLSEEAKAAWTAYRQALRDLPQDYETPGEIQWPTPPE